MKQRPTDGDITPAPSQREAQPLSQQEAQPLPQRGEHYFDEIVNIIERLRAPGGCPWDRKQTLESLRKCITEEAYELADAITRGSMPDILEESGDLLLQVVFVASLANEQGAFDMRGVVRAICDKLIRRHPHVFGDAAQPLSQRADAGDSEAVLRNWERIKMEERRDKAAGAAVKDEELSVLAGVPSGLPPLLKANRMQAKVAHVGFDWPKDSEGTKMLFGKLDEEVAELKEAAESGDARSMEDELGDVLFVTVNVARRLGVDPDAALNRVCDKFRSRFRLMEQMAAGEGHAVSDYTLAQLNTFWNRAKEQLRIRNSELLTGIRN